MSASILTSVPLAPPDPILGITESYNADANPKKVNLGVGVYYGDDGKVPLLECVRRAEADRVKAAPARAYLPDRRHSRRTTRRFANWYSAAPIPRPRTAVWSRFRRWAEPGASG